MEIAVDNGLKRKCEWRIGRTGEKSYFLVAMFTSIYAGMGMTLVLLVSVLRKRIENVIIGERVDETIEITGDKLFYTFRIKLWDYFTPSLYELLKSKAK